MNIDLIQAEILSLLGVLITTFAGLITTYVVGYLRKKGVISQLENNKEIVKIVVNAIEQMYEALDGEDKFAMAKERLIKLANEKKLNISEEELNLLIESTVKEMNDKAREELNN